MACALPRADFSRRGGRLRLDAEDLAPRACLRALRLCRAASRGRDLHLGRAARGAAAGEPGRRHRAGNEVGDAGVAGMTSLTAPMAFWETLLRLGRVSNLPTVWTNTLAGTLLAGGDWQNARTLTVVAAMSLFYEGGMFLND